MSGFLTTGVVAFSNLTEHEIYNGKTTGKFSLVITVDNAEAAKLEELGVKLKQYDGHSQRKFATQFPVKVKDLEDKPIAGELGYGSVVRVWWDGKHNEEHGFVPYLQGVRVLEHVENSGEEPEDF